MCCKDIQNCVGCRDWATYEDALIRAAGERCLSGRVFRSASGKHLCGIELLCIVHALGLNSCFELAQNTSLTNYLFIRHLSVLIPTPPPPVDCS